MRKDDSGQFLLLTSIVVAVGLVVLLVFINQSSISGYSSSESIMNFPKNDIRDIRAATAVEAQQIAIAENNNLLASDRKADLINNFTIYAKNLQNLYAQQGDVVSASCININPGEPSEYGYLDAAQLMLNYSNGDTSYGEIYLVVFNSSYAGAMASPTPTPTPSASPSPSPSVTATPTHTDSNANRYTDSNANSNTDSYSDSDTDAWTCNKISINAYNRNNTNRIWIRPYV